MFLKLLSDSMRTAVYKELPHQKSDDMGLPRHMSFVNPDTVGKGGFKREISGENTTEALVKSKLNLDECFAGACSSLQMNETSVDLDKYYHLISPAYLRSL